MTGDIIIERLNEEFVCTEAIAFPKAHYLSEHNLQKIAGKREATVVLKGEKGWLDGLLTFRDTNKRIITVALEAKSRKHMQA